jgi:hypothetical protein
LLACLTGFATYSVRDDEGDDDHGDDRDDDRDDENVEEKHRDLSRAKRLRLKAIITSMRNAKPLSDDPDPEECEYSESLLDDDQFVHEVLTQLEVLDEKAEGDELIDMFARLDGYCTPSKRRIMLARYCQGVHTLVQS